MWIYSCPFFCSHPGLHTSFRLPTWPLPATAPLKTHRLPKMCSISWISTWLFLQVSATCPDLGGTQTWACWSQIAWIWPCSFFFFLWGLHNYHLVRSVNCNQTLMLFFFKTSIHSRQNIQRPLHMEWVTMTDWNCVEKSSNLANKGLDIVYTIKR